MDERFAVPDWLPEELEETLYGDLIHWECPDCGASGTSYENELPIICGNCDTNTEIRS